MAVLYIGGDNAMVSANLPIAAVRVFQGSLLLAYLIAATFVRAIASTGHRVPNGARHERHRIHFGRHAGRGNALPARSTRRAGVERAGVLNLGVEG